jgi:GDPmannose 4,6-dehydratase
MYYRPAEVNELKGDFSKARGKLSWEPTVGFHEVIKIMICEELEGLRPDFSF